MLDGAANAAAQGDGNVGSDEGSTLAWLMSEGEICALNVAGLNETISE
jgi:hypothetical protein